MLNKRMMQGLAVMALAPLALAANATVTAPETEPNESAHCYVLFPGMITSCPSFGKGGPFGSSNHFY